MGAEDIYIQNSVDKDLIQKTLNWRKFTELAGGFIAALVSYMLSDYAQYSVAGQGGHEEQVYITTNSSTMRMALATVLLVVVLLTLMLAYCMFKEMPIE